MIPKVTVTVSGPTGCGKSGVAAEIETALLAIGCKVEWASAEDRLAARTEMEAIAKGQYSTLNEPPTVVIREINEPVPREATP